MGEVPIGVIGGAPRAKGCERGAAPPPRASTRRRRWPRGAAGAAKVALVALSVLPARARAQEPADTLPPPDTVAVDTLAPPPDSVAAAVPVADSLPPVLNLPRLPMGPPAGFATGTWVWDAQGIMGERDLTLLEVLDRIPGLLPLRGGDYGAPETVTAFGLGRGRIRLFRDGFEVLPLQGGVPDLALVGLGGLEEIRVERGPGELRIHLTSAEVKEPRPFSMVEAGTGDLDTNFFRGTVLHPRALGGSLAGVLERIDTRGTDGRETGSRLGAWLRYGLHFGEDMGIVAEGRRVRRDIGAEAFPIEVSRTDWAVRARGRFLDGRVTGEAFTGSSSLESGDTEAVLPVDRTRSQHGLRVGLEQGPVWARGAVRLFGGPDVPARALEIEAGGELPGLGGAYGRWSREAWAGQSAGAVTAHAWSEPVFGLSAFASYDDGVRGGPLFPPFVEVDPPAEGDPPLAPAPETWAYGLTDVRNLRAGASFRWRSLNAAGAWLRLEMGSLPPLGLDLDRGGPSLPGVSVTGWEGTLRLELPVDGFALTGAHQAWSEEARYLPKRIYQGGIDFHDVFMESRNLEVWGSLGVEGRDPMLVPVPGPWGEPELERVPFFQSWNADVQVRILTVHIFLRWDNFTLRNNNQDFPGRRIPVTRSIYGVKWILWN